MQEQPSKSALRKLVLQNFVMHYNPVALEFESKSLKISVKKLLKNDLTQRHFSRISIRNRRGKIHGKHLCQNLLFNKILGQSPTLLKKRLWHSCFPVNFTKFLGTSFLQKMLFKIGVLKNLAKLTQKHMCCNLVKKTPIHVLFLWNLLNF